MMPNTRFLILLIDNTMLECNEIKLNPYEFNREDATVELITFGEQFSSQFKMVRDIKSINIVQDK